MKMVGLLKWTSLFHMRFMSCIVSKAMAACMKDKLLKYFTKYAFINCRNRMLNTPSFSLWNHLSWRARVPLSSLLPGSLLQVIDFTWCPRCKLLPDYTFRVETSRHLGPEDLDWELPSSTLSLLTIYSNFTTAFQKIISVKGTILFYMSPCLQWQQKVHIVSGFPRLEIL